MSRKPTIFDFVLSKKIFFTVKKKEFVPLFSGRETNSFAKSYGLDYKKCHFCKVYIVLYQKNNKYL